MLFDEAVEEFRKFLLTQGHSGPLQWIAPGDVAFWCGELLIRRRNGAEDHAKHVFDRAQERASAYQPRPLPSWTTAFAALCSPLTMQRMQPGTSLRRH